MIQLNKFAYQQIELKIPSTIKICNPSIIKFEDNWLVLVRAIEENINIKNRKGFLYQENWLIKLDSQLNQIESNLLDENKYIDSIVECNYGLEDGRLFEWKNKLWGLFSGLNIVNKKFINTMCLCQIHNNEITDLIVIKSPNEKNREKNWIPLVKDNELYIIYQADPLEVYKYTDKKLVLISKEHKNSNKYFTSGSSTAIQYDQNYIFVTHHREKINFLTALYLKVTDNKKYKRKKINFFHQFHYVDNNLKIINSSKKFIFEQEGIEFCGGIATDNQKIIISYGVDDKKAKLITIKKANFNYHLSKIINFEDKKWCEITIKEKNIPEIDLLLLNYNNFEKFGKNCIESIYKNDISNVNIFVLDNGSSDDSKNQLTNYSKENNFKLTISEKNFGFAKGMNLLAKQGHSEWLLLVNSDTILPNNTLKTLSKILSNLDEDIAAIGPITNNAGNEQKYYFSETDKEQVLNELIKITNKQTNLLISAYRLDFFFVAIRRSVWEELNGLDEDFGIGYYEDFEFCLRVKQLNKKLVFTEDLGVYHFGSGSFSNNTKKLIRDNKLIIQKKHTSITFPHIRDVNLSILKVYNSIEQTDYKYKKVLIERKINRINHLRNSYPKTIIKKIYWCWKIRKWKV